MKNIFVYDASDKRVQVQLVKYFKYKYTNYFIYTTNEMDEKGFVKLYVVKVMKELGTIVSCNITDDDDWKSLQKIVKNVIKEIKDKKIKSFTNLDIENLTDIRIENARFFKLDPKLVDILLEQSEEQIATSEVLDNLEKPEINELVEINIPVENELKDYKTLYNNMKEEKSALDEILSKMLMEITEYKMQYGELEIPEDDEKPLELKEIIPKNNEDYENLYLKISQEKEALDVVLSKMLREITEYKLKYGDLKS